MTTATCERLSDNFGVYTGIEPLHRLPAETRALAARYLEGQVGPTMIRNEPVLMEKPGNPLAMAGIVMHIAGEAPLRVLPGERVVGAATMYTALKHCMPFTRVTGVSHTTLDFERALLLGYNGLRAEIDAALASGLHDAKGITNLKAMRLCIDAALVWNDRYLALLRERRLQASGSECEVLRQAIANLEHVPAAPPRTFREGIQALWSFWSFQRLCGNWPGIGRFDKMLGPLLEHDLAAGAITVDEARDWIAHFWIHGCEWILPPAGPAGGEMVTVAGSGDGQTYQNIVLGGIDETGAQVDNLVTRLVLEAAGELHIADFPIAVRMNAATAPDIREAVARIQQAGGGIAAIYNETLIIASLVEAGIPLAKARNFANDGCWEAIIPGETAFTYYPFDMLALFQEVLNSGKDFPTYEELYRAFIARLDTQVHGMAATMRNYARHGTPVRNATDEVPAEPLSVPLVSLLTRGCVERGRDYYDRGANFTVCGLHAGGIPDTANSLNAVRTLVYEEQRFTLSELRAQLASDWPDEALRRQVSRSIDYYGSGCSRADDEAARVVADFARLVKPFQWQDGVFCPAGISTFGREIEYARHRKATPFGARAGAILASNMAPTPGTESNGPTGVIRSFCRLGLKALPNGTPLELKLSPSAVRGDDGRAALAALMQTFVNLGGWFLHIEVADTRLLRAAQKDPGRYPNLAVRISGWSARFATLNKDWQEMIINRTEHAAR